MVHRDGLEPSTGGLRDRYSTNWVTCGNIFYNFLKNFLFKHDHLKRGRADRFLVQLSLCFIWSGCALRVTTTFKITTESVGWRKCISCGTVCLQVLQSIPFLTWYQCRHLYFHFSLEPLLSHKNYCGSTVVSAFFSLFSREEDLLADFYVDFANYFVSLNRSLNYAVVVCWCQHLNLALLMFLESHLP